MAVEGHVLVECVNPPESRATPVLPNTEKAECFRVRDFDSRGRTQLVSAPSEVRE